MLEVVLLELLKCLRGAIDVHLGARLHHLDVGLGAFDLGLDQHRVGVHHHGDGLAGFHVLEAFDEQLRDHAVLQGGDVDHVGVGETDDTDGLNVAAP